MYFCIYKVHAQTKLPANIHFNGSAVAPTLQQDTEKRAWCWGRVWIKIGQTNEFDEFETLIARSCSENGEIFTSEKRWPGDFISIPGRAENRRVKTMPGYPWSYDHYLGSSSVVPPINHGLWIQGWHFKLSQNVKVLNTGSPWKPVQALGLLADQSKVLAILSPPDYDSLHPTIRQKIQWTFSSPIVMKKSQRSIQHHWLQRCPGSCDSERFGTTGAMKSLMVLSHVRSLHNLWIIYDSLWESMIIYDHLWIIYG